MTDEQVTTLWIGATRYYLGRMTYAVSDFCQLLRQTWDLLPDRVKDLIRRDVEIEFERDDLVRSAESQPSFLPLGCDCDRGEWEKVRQLWSGVGEQA